MEQHVNKGISRKRILFVNDEADTTATIKVGLTNYGFDVDAFEDAKSALQAETYDVLLLDVLMKGINGFKLYDEMRKIDENIRICFITASNTAYGEYKRAYPRIEQECFIQKPITIKELANILRSILSK
jgi:DNA-binding response OmpR family regulator